MDRYQEEASLIMYDAMILLRSLMPGSYNGFMPRYEMAASELFALTSRIADGLHNVPEIMVADVSEADRGKNLIAELSIFMSSIKAIDLPANMPHPWMRMMDRIRCLVAIEQAMGAQQ